MTLAFQDGQELSGARSNANQLSPAAGKFCRSCRHTWLSCEPAKSRLFIATCAFANDVTEKTPPPSGFYGFVPNKGEEFASQEHLHCMQLQLLVALQAPMKFHEIPEDYFPKHNYVSSRPKHVEHFDGGFLVCSILLQRRCSMIQYDVVSCSSIGQSNTSTLHMGRAQRLNGSTAQLDSFPRYVGLLRQSSMKDGIEIEAQRSRLEILKMMHNMKSLEMTTDARGFNFCMIC